MRGRVSRSVPGLEFKKFSGIESTASSRSAKASSTRSSRLAETDDASRARLHSGLLRCGRFHSVVEGMRRRHTRKESRRCLEIVVVPTTPERRAARPARARASRARCRCEGGCVSMTRTARGSSDRARTDRAVTMHRSSHLSAADRAAPTGASTDSIAWRSFPYRSGSTDCSSCSPPYVPLFAFST